MIWVAFLLLSVSFALAAPPDGYRLAWNDEFQEFKLGQGAWRDHFAVWDVHYLDSNSDKGFKLSDETFDLSGVTVGERLAQTGLWGDGPFMHAVDDGVLALQTFPNPSPDSFDGLPYLASMISGQDLYAQYLGYWEVRFRVPRLPSGHHIALWLLPDSHDWPPEVDLAEFVASEPGTVFANVHGLDAPDITAFRPPNWLGWCTVGFEWTESEMTWYFNGREVRRHSATLSDYTQLYFLASFEIGGRWPGEPAANTLWPGRLEIDYVRIYQRTGP